MPCRTSSPCSHRRYCDPTPIALHPLWLIRHIFSFNILKEVHGRMFFNKFPSCLNKMRSPYYKVIILIMLSHIEGFYVITFLRINDYDKWNDDGMWIYLHLLLPVLGMQFIWFSNLKWASSTLHVYGWPMDVCDWEVEHLAFSYKLLLRNFSLDFILLR